MSFSQSNMKDSNHLWKRADPVQLKHQIIIESTAIYHEGSLDSIEDTDSNLKKPPLQKKPFAASAKAIKGFKKHFFGSLFSFKSLQNLPRETAAKSPVSDSQIFNSDSTLEGSAHFQQQQLSRIVESTTERLLSTSAPTAPVTSRSEESFSAILGSISPRTYGALPPLHPGSQKSLEDLLTNIKIARRSASIRVQNVSDTPSILSRGMSRSLSREYEAKKYAAKRTPSQNRTIVETNLVSKTISNNTSFTSPNGKPIISQGRVNQYHLFETIGNGAFGRVVLAMDGDTQQFFACKIMSKSRLMRKFRFQHSKFTPLSEEDKMMKIKREVAVLKKVSDHHSIIKLCEVLDDATDENLYLFFEWCERGPVMEMKFGTIVPFFSENLARDYFRDIVLGLEFRKFIFTYRQYTLWVSFTGI